LKENFKHGVRPYHCAWLHVRMQTPVGSRFKWKFKGENLLIKKLLAELLNIG